VGVLSGEGVIMRLEFVKLSAAEKPLPWLVLVIYAPSRICVSKTTALPSVMGMRLCMLIQLPFGSLYMEKPNFTRHASDHSAMPEGILWRRWSPVM
jgi:hypothetical protein